MKQINSKIEFNLWRKLFVEFTEHKCQKVIQNTAPTPLRCLYDSYSTLDIHRFSISLL